MEPIQSRIDLFQTALERLEESLELLNDKSRREYTQFRDSVIQRFEFSFDLLWKCLRDSIHTDSASPRGVFKDAFLQGIIDDPGHKVVLKMLDDRNDSSHRYDEGMAEVIAHNVFKYHEFMNQIVDRLRI